MNCLVALRNTKFIDKNAPLLDFIMRMMILKTRDGKVYFDYSKKLKKNLSLKKMIQAILERAIVS